jgi:hypothetical protein
VSDEKPAEVTTYDLRVFWRKKDRDIVYDGPSSPDRHLMDGMLTARRMHRDGFDPSLQDELIARGYDITTLKFSVRRFQHPWIQRGRDIWHRKTGEKRRVHHVRWETGEGFVRMLRAGEAFGTVEIPRDLRWADGYTPIADIERDYQATAPLPLKALLAAEGAGL